MPELSHTGEDGRPRMVDVGDKPESARQATAEAVVRFSEAMVLRVLREASPKGDVLATARLAGVMAAKRTPELIPLCHPLLLTFIDVSAATEESPPGVRLVATVRCRGQTGVEMEALTAATVAALTVIDMLKSVDRWMRIESVQLLSKSGGRSGDIRRPE
jgi:cyclic pyranopterin phosphate synthase